MRTRISNRAFIDISKIDSWNYDEKAIYIHIEGMREYETIEFDGKWGDEARELLKVLSDFDNEENDFMLGIKKNE